MIKTEKQIDINQRHQSGQSSLESVLVFFLYPKSNRFYVGQDTIALCKVQLEKPK